MFGKIASCFTLAISLQLLGFFEVQAQSNDFALENCVQDTIDEPSKVWGFHVHFDSDSDSDGPQFLETLYIQKALINYLEEERIPIARSSIFDPGYGPHRNLTWEARIEPIERDIKFLSHALGKVINWMIYHGSPNMWVHLLTHDESKEDLLTEFTEHNELHIFFDSEPNLDLNFFLDPPRDENHRVIDTKTPNEWSVDKVQTILQSLPIEKEIPYLKAEEFHIHLNYTTAQAETIAKVASFLERFMQEQQITPKCNGFYLADENGPHTLPGYEIQLEGETATDALGEIVTFLMMNRQGLPIYIHPVSAFLKSKRCIIENYN